VKLADYHLSWIGRPAIPLRERDAENNGSLDRALALAEAANASAAQQSGCDRHARVDLYKKEMLPLAIATLRRCLVLNRRMRRELITR
jgi:hypothetical protein